MKRKRNDPRGVEESPAVTPASWSCCVCEQSNLVIYALCCSCRAPNPRPPQSRSEKNRWIWSDRESSPFASSAANGALAPASAPGGPPPPSPSAAEEGDADECSLSMVDRSRAAQAASNFQFLASNDAAAPTTVAQQACQRQMSGLLNVPRVRAVPLSTRGGGATVAAATTAAVRRRRHNNQSEILEQAEWAATTAGDSSPSSGGSRHPDAQRDAPTSGETDAPAPPRSSYFKANFNFDIQEQRERHWSLLGGGACSEPSCMLCKLALNPGSIVV